MNDSTIRWAPEHRAWCVGSCEFAPSQTSEGYHLGPETGLRPESGGGSFALRLAEAVDEANFHEVVGVRVTLTKRRHVVHVAERLAADVDDHGLTDVATTLDLTAAEARAIAQLLTERAELAERWS